MFDDQSTHAVAPWYRRPWMFIPVLAIAVLVAIALVRSRPAMEHQPAEVLPVLVQTISPVRQAVVPAITGYGDVQADVLLETKAEISGRVLYVHPQLRAGYILPAGVEVLRIDSKDYQLALKQAEADLRVSEAQYKEQSLSLEDAKVRLALSRENLKLAEQEEARQARLLKKGSLSQSSFEKQQSTVLQLKQEVQSLQNQVHTLPAQLEVQQAQIVIAQAKVETQSRNVERASVRLPFAARIASLSVEENQYVSQGSALFSAQTIDKVLVNAQFPLEQFRRLAKSFRTAPPELERAFLEGDSSRMFSQLGMSASIQLAGDAGATWPAVVERLSGNLDSATRTLGVIVSVADPYRDVRPGVKPPLLQGMYTEITLKGQARSYVAVPRKALHGDELYLMTAAGDLLRYVAKGETQGDMFLLEQDLPSGAQVITSDVFPAINGMKLRAQEDVVLADQVQSWLQENAPERSAGVEEMKP